MTGPLFLVALSTTSLALSIIMHCAWLIWRKTRNAGWIDTVWTFGLGAVGCAGALATMIGTFGFMPRAAIVFGLIAIWSARLGAHIAQRTSGIKDDPRYAKLVEGYGSNAPRGMFWLAQKQAWVSIPLGMSMLLAAWNPVSELRLQDFIGVAVLLVGIAGEALEP